MAELQHAEVQVQEADWLATLRARFGELHLTLADALAHAARQRPNRPALMEPERESLSFADLFALATKTIKTLNAMGFTPASRIALLLPTNTESASVYICLLAGITIVPFSAEAPADHYERYFRHAKIDAVLLKQNETPVAREVAARLGIGVIEIAYRADGPVGIFEIVGAADQLATEALFSRPDDVAILALGSGTTDIPKLLPFTHRRLAIGHYSGATEDVGRSGEPPVIVNFLPMQHMAAQGHFLFAVMSYSPFTCTPSQQAATIYHYLARYKPEAAHFVPAVLQAFLDEAPNHQEEIEQFHFARISIGSAMVSSQLVEQAGRIFRCPIANAYGAQEALSIAQMVMDPADPNFRAGSVGKPHSYVKVKITDESGIELPAGEVGEIIVLSPMVFDGYEDNPEANREAFHGRWFRTGDGGYLDADGYIFLTGRIKEVVNRGGSKVSPNDVDAVLLQHPAVTDAAAFGFPHSVLGEDVAAAIVLRVPDVTEDELRLFAVKRLPMSHVPSRFVFVEEIPKTSLGKPRRTLLAERFKGELRR